MSEKWMTATEVAKYFSISVVLARQVIALETIHIRDARGRYFVKVSELDKFVDRHKAGPGQKKHNCQRLMCISPRHQSPRSRR